MFVIVVGGGRLGSGLARALSSRGNDVVVISKKVDPRWLGPDFDGITLEGNPIDQDLLEEAGIRKAEVFVAATSDDVVNAMAVQIAREVFSVPLALARITDPARERFYRSQGLDTVCPTATGINQILDLIWRQSSPTLEGMLDPGLAGVLPLPEWQGLALGELPHQAGRTVLGIERGGAILSPQPSLVLSPGDVLILRRMPAREAQA